MAARVGRQIRVSDVIAQAKIQGCEYKNSPLRLITEHGEIPIKYLYNPKTKDRLNISDYDLDDYMLEEELSNAERRLKIRLW
jgi:hypothetical protein